MKICKLAMSAAAALAFCLGSFTAPQAEAGVADVIFIVDESGSMTGEHTWLGNMISSLDTALIAAGVGGAGSGGNNYGLVGYGSSRAGHGSSQRAHSHSVGGGQWGTALEFATAAGTLVASGSREDGYEAIQYALDNYTFRSDASVNFVLVTDEDRDVAPGAGGISRESILSNLIQNDVILNAVVNATFDGLIGVDGEGPTDKGFQADGSGGYFEVAAPGDPSTASGSTFVDYSTLAFATEGASWDLNVLRSGGNNAVSFTNAFVDIKVEEIVENLPEVPEPSSLAVFGGLIGLGICGRRRRNKED